MLILPVECIEVFISMLLIDKKGNIGIIGVSQVKRLQTASCLYRFEPRGKKVAAAKRREVLVVLDEPRIQRRCP